jgi:hypothetical protein
MHIASQWGDLPLCVCVCVCVCSISSQHIRGAIDPVEEHTAMQLSDVLRVLGSLVTARCAARRECAALEGKTYSRGIESSCSPSV